MNLNPVLLNKRPKFLKNAACKTKSRKDEKSFKDKPNMCCIEQHRLNYFKEPSEIIMNPCNTKSCPSNNPEKCWQYHIMKEKILAPEVDEPKKNVLLPSYLRRIKRLIAAHETIITSRPSAPDPGNVDPILDFLRVIKLPVIWIVGLPTNQTVIYRQHLIKEIVERYEFSLIDLDIWIEKWRNRFKYDLLRKLQIPSSKGEELLTKLNLDEQIEEDIYQNANVEKPCIVLPRTDMKLTLNKTIELLKFAMVESLPSKGFLIVNFPFNQVDALKFEQTFYEVSIGIYFGKKVNTKVIVPKLLDHFQLEIDRQIIPKFFKRKISFVPQEAERLINAYGNRFIRIPTDHGLSMSKIIKLVCILLEKNLYKMQQQEKLRGFTPGDLPLIPKTPKTYESVADDENYESDSESISHESVKSEFEKPQSHLIPTSLKSSSSLTSILPSISAPGLQNQLNNNTSVCSSSREIRRTYLISKSSTEKDTGAGDFYSGYSGSNQDLESLKTRSSTQNNFLNLSFDSTSPLQNSRSPVKFRWQQMPESRWDNSRDSTIWKQTGDGSDYCTSNSNYGNYYYSDPVSSGISQGRRGTRQKYSEYLSPATPGPSDISSTHSFWQK